LDIPMGTATNTSRSLARRGRCAGAFSFPDPINEVSAHLVAGLAEGCERCNNIAGDRRELNPTSAH
jgi:hypothetical protein